MLFGYVGTIGNGEAESRIPDIFLDQGINILQLSEKFSILDDLEESIHSYLGKFIPHLGHIPLDLTIGLDVFSSSIKCGLFEASIPSFSTMFMEIVNQGIGLMLRPLCLIDVHVAHKQSTVCFKNIKSSEKLLLDVVLHLIAGKGFGAHGWCMYRTKKVLQNLVSDNQLARCQMCSYSEQT